MDKIISKFDFAKVLILIFAVLIICRVNLYAQGDDLEYVLDSSSSSVILPNVFRPNIDLGGRGFNADNTWPQELSAIDVLDRWQKDIGFSGIYRMQFNLWEIGHLSKDKEAQAKLLANYEKIMQSVTNAGGDKSFLVPGRRNIRPAIIVPFIYYQLCILIKIKIC